MSGEAEKGRAEGERGRKRWKRGESKGLLSWRMIQALTVLLVLGLFLWGLRPILSPFVLFLVLVAVLLPFRGRTGHATLVVTAAALTTLWILATTGFLLAPFVLAMVLAYIFDPLVDRVQRLGISRTPAIALLVLPAGVVVAIGLILGVPALWEQLASLSRQLPELARRLGDWAESLQGQLLSINVPYFDPDAFLASLTNGDPGDQAALIEQWLGEIGRQLWAGVLGLGQGIGTALTIAGYVFLTPVLTFFLLRDWDQLVARVDELLPRDHRESIADFAAEYDGLLSRYLRGQITVALTVGLITGVGLFIAQFPYAALLGAIVAVFSVVPYLGLLLSLVPAVAIALLSDAILLSLLKIGIVYGIAQGLEGAVISPRIVGDSVGLHPVWVVLALAVGGYFFGFVGLLIGVPVAVGIKLLVIRGLDRYRSSSLYAGGNGDAAPAGE